MRYPGLFILLLLANYLSDTINPLVAGRSAAIDE